MNKSYNMNIDSGEKTWLTPPHIIEALGPFDLDPCCPPTMPWRTATRMVHWPEDGLQVDWTGKRVWCNPPYGRDAMPFLRKMAANRGAGGGIALIFARTDTSARQDLIFPFAVGVLFLRGRLSFYRVSPDGRAVPGQTATAPSALVAYSEYDFDRLRECGLKGSLVRLRTNGPIEIHYPH